MRNAFADEILRLALADERIALRSRVRSAE
jgi:hypothetical protein